MTVTIHALVIAFVLCFSRPAHALEEYADAIAAELDLNDKPSCLYCHTRNERGLAVDTALGDALKARGFSRRLGIASLRDALQRLDNDNVDTDDDGVTDIDELSAGANPNDPRDKGLPPDDCSVTPMRASSSTTWSLLAVCAWLLWRRAARPTQQRNQRRT